MRAFIHYSHLNVSRLEISSRGLWRIVVFFTRNWGILTKPPSLHNINYWPTSHSYLSTRFSFDVLEPEPEDCRGWECAVITSSKHQPQCYIEHGNRKPNIYPNKVFLTYKILLTDRDGQLSQMLERCWCSWYSFCLVIKYFPQQIVSFQMLVLEKDN